jgi:acetolactate synthase-1/3 small subunit
VGATGVDAPTISTGDSTAHVPADRTISPAAARGDAPEVCHVIRDKPGEGAGVVLELRVRNHPGTMSHVTGLFARRGFNLDAILCVPLADGATSLMRLLVSNDARLEQVERQLAKLHDVLDVRHRTDLPADYFGRLVSG